MFRPVGGASQLIVPIVLTVSTVPTNTQRVFQTRGVKTVSWRVTEEVVDLPVESEGVVWRGRQVSNVTSRYASEAKGVFSVLV